MMNRANKSALADWWFTVDRVALGCMLLLAGIGLMLAFAASPATTGGPVTAGGAYLVGERGPEVFRPASAGSVEPAAGAMTVNVTVQGGGEPALIRSDAQIAQALARAVSLGARRL